MKPLTRNDIHDLLAYLHTKACKGAKDTSKMAATKACSAHKAKVIQALFDPFKELRKSFVLQETICKEENLSSSAETWARAIELLDAVIEAKP